MSRCSLRFLSFTIRRSIRRSSAEGIAYFLGKSHSNPKTMELLVTTVSIQGNKPRPKRPWSSLDDDNQFHSAKTAIAQIRARTLTRHVSTMEASRLLQLDDFNPRTGRRYDATSCIRDARVGTSWSPTTTSSSGLWLRADHLPRSHQISTWGPSGITSGLRRSEEHPYGPFHQSIPTKT